MVVWLDNKHRLHNGENILCSCWRWHNTKLWICISYMLTVFFLVPSFWGKECDCRSHLSSWLGALLMVHSWTTHIGVLSCDANELYFYIKKIWSKSYFLLWATEWTTAGFHQKHIVARQSQTYSSRSLCELQDKLKAPGIPKVYEQLNLLSLKICPVSAGGNCFYRQSLSNVGANEDCCSLLMKVDK
jgi:hypothetical protein